MQKKQFFITIVFSVLFFEVFASSNTNPEKEFEKAYVHFWHQQYDSALFDFQKFIDAENLQLNPRKSKIASMHRYRGHCFESLQLFDLAIAENQKAWQIYTAINDSANISVTLQKLGDLFYQQGKPEQALFFVNKAIPYFEKMRWISKLETANFLLGEIYFELGDLEAAKTSFEKILTIQSYYNTKTDLTYLSGKVYFYLAKILWKRNLFEKSDSLLNLAEKIFVINSKQLPQFNANVIELWLFKAVNSPSEKKAKQLFSKAAELLPKAQGMAAELEIANISFYLGLEDIKMAEEKLRDFEKQLKTAEFSAKNQREYLLLYTEFLDKKYKKQSSVEFLKKKLESLDRYFFKSENSQNIYSLLNDFAFSGQKNKILFDVAVKTSLQIYELIADKNYLEKAFQYAEYFSFNEINKNRSNSGKNLQHEKQIELAHLNFRINELISEIEHGEKQKQDELVLLINEFENLQRFFQPAFEKDFFQNYRHLLADIQQTLGENELYLKFYETDPFLFQFIISAEQVKIIQLSTHATINSQYPQLSEIQFSPTNTNQSNRLFFYEIVEHNWNNELVILSACNTGVGEHFANYGTVSLANAFQLGGAQSVIGANWLASDFFSSQIITKTIKNCVDGMGVGTALQKAKIHFLETSDDLFTHPFYWAVYSYQGAEKKLVLSQQKKMENPWIVFPLAVLLLVYFLQQFVRSRKINR